MKMNNIDYNMQIDRYEGLLKTLIEEAKRIETYIRYVTENECKSGKTDDKFDNNELNKDIIHTLGSFIIQRLNESDQNIIYHIHFYQDKIDELRRLQLEQLPNL